eukprot:171105_1
MSLSQYIITHSLSHIHLNENETADKTALIIIDSKCVSWPKITVNSHRKQTVTCELTSLSLSLVTCGASTTSPNNIIITSTINIFNSTINIPSTSYIMKLVTLHSFNIYNNIQHLLREVYPHSKDINMLYIVKLLTFINTSVILNSYIWE